MYNQDVDTYVNIIPSTALTVALFYMAFPLKTKRQIPHFTPDSWQTR